MASDELKAPASLTQGRRLGRYILCYELASGGMATVYLARAPGLAGFEKLVAMKLIHPHLAKEQEFIDMFLDEARIAARIDHPNVCGVFDFGEADGTYFLAMEYLSGETLSRITRALARATPPAEEPHRSALLAHIAQQACEGLHAAHELRDDDGELARVVHRDVTPQNLFVGFDGSVRIVDFGVASATGRVHQTNAGTLKGKFAYMSPEQLQRRDVERQSDIFSLGVCLWEMLTLRRLFHRDTEYETLKSVLEGPIPAPSTVREGIPAALDAIVLRALERDPAARYETARDFGRELGSFVASCGGSSAADVAELMTTLFPRGRQKRRDLVERARALDPEVPSTSRIVAMQTSTVSKRANVETPSGSRLGRIVAMAVFLLAVLGGAAWAALSGETPPEALPTARADVPGEAAPENADDGITIVEEGAVVAGQNEETIEDAPERPAVLPQPTAERADAPATPPGAPRVRRHPVVAPRGEGTVNVATPPGWAEIFVDGRSQGRSPAGLRLSAGTHRVRLLPYGEGPPIDRRVEVEVDEITRLVVRLPE